MKKLALLDFCPSDYFRGYSAPVIAVPVYDTMTNKEVSEAIQSEINLCFDLYEGDEIIEFADDFCKELLQKPDEMYVSEQINLDINIDEGGECLYLYFGVIDPVYSNGIMFLN